MKKLNFMSIVSAGALILSLTACSTPSFLKGHFAEEKETAPQENTLPDAGIHTPAKVTMLIPLSGKDASLGEALQNAATLAFTDHGYPAFELMFEDTASSAVGAEKGAARALSNGSQLILGPVFADEARAAGAIAGRSHIPLISFSTDLGAAGPARMIMGILPQDQAAAVARFAATQGLKTILILAPQNTYGQVTVRAFTAAAMAAGITPLPPVWLAEGQTALPPLDAVLSAAPVQAVFMPLPPAQIAGLLPALRTVTGKSDITILGTGLLDDPTLTARYPILTGALYASPAGSARTAFMDTYARSYGTTAPRLATLAYDSVSLALILGRSGFLSKDLDQKLLDPNGYAGVDGTFRFLSNGLIERQLDIVRLTGTGRAREAPARVQFDGQ